MELYNKNKKIHRIEISLKIHYQIIAGKLLISLNLFIATIKDTMISRGIQAKKSVIEAIFPLVKRINLNRI